MGAAFWQLIVVPVRGHERYIGRKVCNHRHRIRIEDVQRLPLLCIEYSDGKGHRNTECLIIKGAFLREEVSDALRSLLEARCVVGSNFPPAGTGPSMPEPPPMWVGIRTHCAFFGLVNHRLTSFFSFLPSRLVGFVTQLNQAALSD
jgi:hypothetical protein